MARRDSRLGWLRPLALAVVLVAALVAPAAISASAAGDDAVSQPGPAASSSTGVDPSATAPTTVPAAPVPPGSSPAQSGATPPASELPAPSPPNPAPTAVTVSRASASASKSVSIVDFAFNAGSITVDAGDTVQWTNDGQVPEGHDVTGDGLDSGVLHSGASYSHTFSSAGTFSYICSIHPSMHGTVTVLARSSGSSGGSNGSSGGGSGSSGTSTPSTTGAGSESAAVSSPDAAGSGSSLPSTGSDSLLLATLGVVLVNLGLALRILDAGRGPRRRS
ncbi:MAG: plastocyanin/azurin family copper-binding protein [Actinomycetota bacterium]